MVEGTERSYTIAEVAEACQVAHTTVRNWVREGKLAAYALPGGHYRITHSTLVAFMSEFGIPMPASLSPQTQVPRMKVLVIDDEAAFCSLVTELLGMHGDRFEVAVASNGMEGVMLAGNLTPDLIVLDVMMPGMNGAEVCRAVRRIEKLARTRIVIVTAYRDAPEVAAAMKCGAHACLFKPVMPDAILKTVNEIWKEFAAERGRGRR